MNISTKIMGAVLTVAVAGTFGYVMLGQNKSASVAVTKNEAVTATAQLQSSKETSTQALITVPESEYPIVGSHGSFWRYATMDELYQNADIVAEIEIMDQETVPVDIGTVSTRSQASVLQVFKGESVPSTLTITEVGGVLDLRTLPKQDKPGSGMEPANSQGIVETALEGSPVMKPKNNYFVFLTKNPNAKWGYNIVGSVQGKLKIDTKTKKIVNTVDKNYLSEEDVFFLQKQLNGKDKSEVESLVTKSK